MENKYSRKEPIKKFDLNQTMYSLVTNEAKNDLDLKATGFIGNSLTYKELFESADTLANSFYNSGVREDDNVAIMTINMPIVRSQKYRKKMAVNKNGKNAITHFKVLKRYDNYTLLEVNIETGRTHQIRVHLSEIGYPIIGDYTYSNGKNEWNIKGQCLHAKILEFTHPITNKQMHLEAELPEYFNNILLELKDRVRND